MTKSRDVVLASFSGHSSESDKLANLPPTFFAIGQYLVILRLTLFLFLLLLDLVLFDGLFEVGVVLTLPIEVEFVIWTGTSLDSTFGTDGMGFTSE